MRPEDLAPLLDAMRQHSDLVNPVGLMTMAPDLGLPQFTRDDVRRCFARLRELASELGLKRLSMGMSGDYDLRLPRGPPIFALAAPYFSGIKSCANS